MSEYLSKIPYAINKFITVESCGDKADVMLKMNTDNNPSLVVILKNSDGDKETYNYVEYDIDRVNQIIDDWFMAKNADDTMSTTEFLRNDGEACPACESCDISIDGYSEGLYSCESCGATWQIVVKLSGYKNLVEGRDQ